MQKKTEVFENMFFEDRSIQETIEYFDEDPKTAIYGILTINSVRPAAISLTLQQFNINGSFSSSQTFVIKSGEQWSMPGVEYACLKYHELIEPRNGFDGAMTLEFVTDKDKPYTTSFATFDYDKKRAISTSTFLGINADGDFIFTTKEKPSTTRNARAAVGDIGDIIQHGDHIMQVPDEGIVSFEEPSEELDTSNFIEDRSAYITSDFYTVSAKKGENQLSLLTVEDYELKEVYSSSGISVEDFQEHFYRQTQFPHSQGAIKLIQSFPKEFLWNEQIDINNITEEKAIDELNSILLNPYTAMHLLDKINTISEAEKNSIYQSYYQYFSSYYNKVFGIEKTIDSTFTIEQAQNSEKELYDSMTNENDLIKKLDEVYSSEEYFWMISFNRKLIETVYPNSPDAIADSPELHNVLPVFYMSSTNPFVDQFDGIDYSFVRGATDTEVEFKKNREKLKNKLKSWKTLELTTVALDTLLDSSFFNEISEYKNKDSSEVFEDGKSPEKDKDKSKSLSVTKDNIKNVLKTLNIEIKLCFKADICFKWGKLGGSVGVGIYISSGADLSDLDFIITLLKKELYKKDYGFKIGFLPCTLNFNSMFILDLAGNVESGANVAFGFCGMYGAEAGFNAKYGINFFCRPYFNPTSYNNKINESYYYAGDVKGNPKDNFCLQMDIIPKLKITIGLYLGQRLGFIGVDYVNTIAFDLGVALGFPYMTSEKKQSGCWIELTSIPVMNVGNAKVYSRVAIGLDGKLKLVAGIKIITRRKWDIKSWQLYNTQWVLNSSGKFESGKKVIKF